MIKEITHAVKAPWFLAALFFLHLSLIVLLLQSTVGSIPATENEVAARGSILLVVAGAILLGFVPALILSTSAIATHSDEMRPLNAWKQWTIYFGQNLFLILNILPYFFLRFLSGESLLPSDFVILNGLVWLSALFIAISLAIAALPDAMSRTWCLIGAGLLVGFHPDLSRFLQWQEGDTFLTYAFVFVTCAFLIIFFVGLANSTQTSTLFKRLTSLVFLIVAGLFIVLTSKPHEVRATIWLAVPLGIFLATCADELGRKPNEKTKVNARRPFLVNPLFSPGWPSALLFTAALTPIVFAAYFLVSGSYAYHHNLWRAFAIVLFRSDAIVGSLIVPTYMCHYCFPRFKAVFVAMVGYNLAIWMISCAIAAFSSIAHPGFCDFLMAFPSIPSLLIGTLTLERLELDRQTYLPAIVLINGLLSVAVLAAMTRTCRLEFGELFRPSDAS